MPIGDIIEIVSKTSINYNNKEQIIMSIETATTYATDIANQITERVESGYPFGHLDNLGYWHDSDECETSGECESATALDYLEDILDINYIVSSDKQYKAARIMIAFGGPTAWINTLTRDIECAWWSDTVRVALPIDYCELLDEALEELYNCI